MTEKKSQPWIYSAWLDNLFVLSPSFVCLLLIFLFPAYFQNSSEVSTISWVILVLMIDVAHVYSTLYRTYFDQAAFQLHKNIFVWVPFFALLVGIMLYSFSSLLFWRVLAYLAVFHFIRQQYGFLRIYSRKENPERWMRIVDEVSIYYSTLYPIIYWHLTPGIQFNWFIDGDFLKFDAPWLLQFATFLFFVIISVYIVKELILIIKNRVINVPRNLLVAGTFLSWYFGIVYFNGDLIFTLLNVVSHGIPYMFLIWVYGRKKHETSGNGFLHLVFSNAGVILFILIIVVIAYVEEGIWDATVWREHPTVFSFFNFIPKISDSMALAFLVPLLALPQITHYILDGFIWKINKDKFNWKEKTLSS